ncbi:MAG: HAD-IIB family hydrolase [Clostridium perfringens]|nr:HAD-IIB family hydrolase [Clostridium perfringens]
MKLLASDFDGTLLVDKKINKRDIEGIKALRKKGHKFIISTGRTLLTMEGVIEKYDLEFDYLVLCNGAVILDKNKNVIKNNLVDFEAVKKIVEEFADQDKIMIYFDDGSGMKLIENKSVDMKNLYFSEEIDFDLVKKEEILDLKSGAVILSICTSDASVERGEEIKKRLIEIFGDELSIDSFNDISMFEITDNSYTFNRAEEGVKAHANNHVDYVHEIVDHIIK